jgi:HSP20 family protein
MAKHFDPFTDIAHLSEMMSRLLDEEIHHHMASHPQVQSDWVPVVDLVEMDDRFVLKADLAGIGRSDITVEVIDCQLVLKGERKLRKREQEEKYFRLERPYGKFVRIFPLPSEVSCAKVSAALKDGVLEVILPKEDKHPARKIPIHCKVE